MNDMNYKYFQALRDGFICGGDIIGTVIGHLPTIQRKPLGYVADNYGLVGFKTRREIFQPHGVVVCEKPMDRSLLEKTVKSIGFVSGLTMNVATIGLINTMLLAEVYGKIEQETISWY